MWLDACVPVRLPCVFRDRRIFGPAARMERRGRRINGEGGMHRSGAGVTLAWPTSVSFVFVQLQVLHIPLSFAPLVMGKRDGKCLGDVDTPVASSGGLFINQVNSALEQRVFANFAA